MKTLILQPSTRRVFWEYWLFTLNRTTHIACLCGRLVWRLTCLAFYGIFVPVKHFRQLAPDEYEEISLRDEYLKHNLPRKPFC